MVGKNRKIIFSLLALLCVVRTLSAQQSEPADSLVRLVKAKSIEMYDDHGRSYRKAIDATFLHNGTYLICDTALWRVEDKLINSWGHVQLVQDETVLTSEKLDYLIDEDLAQFRGGVVQLKNKKDNILRTRNLDYNTKDSTAVFRGGAAMRDQDGQIIESLEGTYNSTTKIFTFRNQVNMYTDSVFVRTSDLIYDGERNMAEFVAYVDFWKEHNMLSAGCGWYKRNDELFFFEREVHGLSQDQEVWCDSLYFYRNSQDIIMHSNVHIQDTSRHVAGMAQYVFYQDSTATITMRNEAAVALRTEQQNNNSKIDTLYMGADSIVYRSVKNCDIGPKLRKVSEERLKSMLEDPVSAYRERVAKEAAEKAAKALEDLAKKDQNIAGALRAKKDKGLNDAKNNSPDNGQKDSPANGDEKAPVEDSADKPSKDSLERLQFIADSTALANDTTKLGFLVAVGKVKIYRSDMQVLCDSLNYTDLDSIARFYINPKVWNEGNRQYTSDSLSVLVRNGGIDRASLMSNAYIITQEDSLYYDQIKGADVMAYFDSTSALRRFDALGGATALFFLQEDDAIATVNKVTCKMMSALMLDGTLDKVFYYDTPKNDAYPLAQMPQADMKMKGFNWSSEERPKGRADITSLKVKPSEREYYEGRPKASFAQTDIYFPGYMKSVYKALEEARIRRREARNAPKNESAADSAVVVMGDSSATTLPSVVPADSVSIALKDSTVAANVSKPAVKDSTVTANVSKPAVKDSTVAVLPPADSLGGVSPDSSSVKPVAVEQVKTEAQLRREEREKRRAEAQARRDARREAAELRYKLRIARRDAKWARLDSLDAIQDALKAQKAQERKRARTRNEVMERMIQDAKDQAKLEAYIRYYEKKKAREDARAAAKRKTKSKNNEQEQLESSGERTPEADRGGEIPAPLESGK